MEPVEVSPLISGIVNFCLFFKSVWHLAKMFINFIDLKEPAFSFIDFLFFLFSISLIDALIFIIFFCCLLWVNLLSFLLLFIGILACNRNKCFGSLCLYRNQRCDLREQRGELFSFLAFPFICIKCHL